MCDRGCLCVIHAQLIWLIRPKSHCRNQRQSEHFEKCANRTLSGLCGCEVVVLLNFVHHHIWILFGRCFQCQWIFGCASQVDAVASTPTQVLGCLALSSDCSCTSSSSTASAKTASAPWEWLTQLRGTKRLVLSPHREPCPHLSSGLSPQLAEHTAHASVLYGFKL